MSSLTARFKVDSYFVMTIEQRDISGMYTRKTLIAPKKEVDFPIIRYTEYTDCYDIVIFDSKDGYMDGGEVQTVINIPKSMLTIANKHLKNDNKSKHRLDN